MSYIHFKSVVDTNFDKITFDGVSLPLAQLKKLIAEKKKYTKQVDFDLEITNTDTNEVYRNENDLIIKNSRVIVKRVVRNSTAPLRAREPAKVVSTSTQQSQQQQTTSTATSTTFSSSANAVQQVTSSSLIVNNSAAATTTTTSSTASLPKTVYDSLAPLNIPSKPIIYQSEAPSSTTNVSNFESSSEKTTLNDSESTSRLDEKAKLESILLNSMTAQGVGLSMIKPSSEQFHLQQQTVYNSFPTNRYGATTLPSTGKPMTMPSRHHLVPSSYRCGICKQTGHSKQQCPNAGLIPKLEERLKFPSGIPKTTLRPAQPGDPFVMLGPDGYVIAEIEQKVAQIKKKDKPSFMDDEDDENSNNSSDAQTLASSSAKIPQELKCPYGDHLLKDAVIIPCCGHFVCCDECIREKISNDEIVECPNQDCDQEIGSLTTITPFHEMRRKVKDYLNDLKLANQRAQTASQNQTESKSSSSKDVFLDLILSGVDSESTKSPNINNVKSDEDLNDLKTEQQQTVPVVGESVVNSSGSESPKTQDSVISTTTEMSATKSTTLISIDQTVNNGNSTTNLNKFISNTQMQPALLPAPPTQISHPPIPTQMPIAAQHPTNQSFAMSRPQLAYPPANIPKVRQTRPNPNLQPILPQPGQPPQYNLQFNRPPTMGGPPPAYLNQAPLGGPPQPPPPHQMGFPPPPPQMMNQFPMQGQRPPYVPFHQDMTGSQYPHHPSNLMMPPHHHLANMPPHMPPQTLPLAQSQNLNKLHHLGQLPPQQPLHAIGYGQPQPHPIMSEAEFYKFQESLRKESKESKSTSASSRGSRHYYSDSRRSNRRTSRSRSRSRTRSRSSSRSSRSNSSGRRRYKRHKSPENRSSYNRSATSSSYSGKHGRYYKRSSRSRSRSRSKERYHNGKKRPSYSRSRSRSPAKYARSGANPTKSESTTKHKDASGSSSSSSSSSKSAKKDKSSSSSSKKDRSANQPMATIDENAAITTVSNHVASVVEQPAEPSSSSSSSSSKKKKKDKKEKERENDLTEISSSSSITSTTTTATPTTTTTTTTTANQKESTKAGGSDTDKEKNHRKSSTHKSSKHKKHKHKRRSSSRDRD